MLSYAITFFIIALIAMALGMGGVAGLSVQIGYLLVILAVIFLIVSAVTGRRTGPPI